MCDVEETPKQVSMLGPVSIHKRSAVKAQFIHKTWDYFPSSKNINVTPKRNTPSKTQTLYPNSEREITKIKDKNRL